VSDLDAATSGQVSTTVGDALFRPVRAGNAFEETVERLLQTIRLGVIGPGESLPSERDLAARLAVGRDTVRDAIRSLSEAGYLVSRRGERALR
jgi:DNA-binding FadR family transcriptional regulator